MKTAVEYLFEMWLRENIITPLMLDQAKEMEKQQIVNAVQIGFYDGVDSARGFTASNKSPQDYYNKTFKSE